MSVEIPSVEELQDLQLAVERRIVNDRRKGLAFTRMHSLVLELGERNGKKLHELCRSMGRGFLLLPGSQSFDLLPSSKQIDFSTFFSFVNLGFAEMGIEMALATGEFRPQEMERWYNARIYDTPIAGLSFPKAEVIVLHKEDWQEMVHLAKKDPKHTIFLKSEGYGSLPPELRNLLAESRSLMDVRQRAIPYYESLSAFFRD